MSKVRNLYCSSIYDFFYWKDENTSNEWKLKNIEELRNRLDGWQLEAFNESYKSKQETGLSLIKKKLLESRNN